MIPKTIHYCWFGKGKLPELALKCIESWKKYLPDYEIIEWNEENFDINSNQYVKEAYEAKKWAFVTDYVRLYVLKEYGGIYMDTDVEVTQNLDKFLNCGAFSGFESNDYIPTGIIGAEKDNKWIARMLQEYDNKRFIKEDGSYDMTTNVVLMTEITKKEYGINLDNSYQELKHGLVMYPSDYFCPKSYTTGKITTTQNTYAIHHFSGSWLSDEQKRFRKQRMILTKVFSEKNALRIFGYYQYILKNDIITVIKKILLKIKNKIINIVFHLYNTKVLKKIKIDNKIIAFESEGDFTDNARALFEYMVKNKYTDKYKLIWIVEDKNKFKHIRYNNVKFISKKHKSVLNKIVFLYHISKVKYFFFTHPYKWFDKKEGQVIVNLWHGTPLKGKGKNLSDSFDYCICTSENMVNNYKEFMGCKDEQILILGQPRNDLLYDNINVINNIIEGQFEKVILAMPTFRQTSRWSDSDVKIPYVIPTIDSEQQLKNLNNILKDNNTLIIIKLHHLQDLRYISKIDLSNIILINDELLMEHNINLYHLISNADAMLTDYSSVAFDYLLLDRPIGYTIPDIDEYSRGFMCDDPTYFMPGEHIYNFEELIEFVKKVKNNEDKFSKKREEIRNITNKYQDNDNCKRVLNQFKI